MAVFQFTLAPLLRLRLHAEDQCKRELGEALRARDAAQAAQKKLEQERESILMAADRDSEIFDPVRRRQLILYLQGLADRLVSAHAQVLEREQGVQSATEALRLAVQQRKILERLREIRQEEHRLAQNRVEQKALDEHAAHFLRRENAARLADVPEP